MTKKERLEISLILDVIGADYYDDAVKIKMIKSIIENHLFCRHYNKDGICLQDSYNCNGCKK